MDTTKQIAMQTGDPASAFISFLWTNYLSNPVFLSMILVVFVLVWIARVFIFDNKNIKLNDRSWFYPLIFIGIVALVVLLKGGIIFQSVMQYMADFVTQLSATIFLYLLFGHKLIKKAGEWGAKEMGLDKPKDEVKDKPVGL